MKSQPRSRSVTPPARNGAARVVCAAALSLAVVGTAGWAYPGAADVGLKGILPDEVPTGLTPDDFAVLGGNWEEWSKGAAEAVIDLYEGEHADAAAQRAALNKVKVKLGTMHKALGDAKYRSIHKELATLHSRLARRVEIAEAILDTLELDPETARAERLKTAYADLASAVKAVERDMNAVQRGRAWLPYVRAKELSQIAANNDGSADAMTQLSKVRNKIANRDSLADAAQKEFLGRRSFLDLQVAIDDALAATEPVGGADVGEVREQAAKLIDALEAFDAETTTEYSTQARAAYDALRKSALDGGARLSRALRTQVYDYNVRIIASEGLMQRFVGETTSQSRPISEPVGEAYVTGNSWTTSRVSVDFKPSSDAARFDIVVDGNVQSTTTATTSQAFVFGGSTGNFQGRKPVTFDGKQFTLGPASVGANASTYANDVDARVFFPLRIIADHIAEGEVARRKPSSDATARDRISQQVRREMDTESGSQFANANVDLEAKLYGPLRELGWYPDAIQLSSSDRELLARARLMEASELGGQAPSLTVSPPAGGLVIQVHESLLNNGTERIDIAGRTMTEDDLRAELEARFTKLLGREFKFTKPAAQAAPAPDAPAPEEDVPSTFVFAEQDPLRFDIGAGTVAIIMRTGLKREGQEDIPMHVITVPLSFHVEGKQVHMQREGSVRVVPGPGVAASIARQNIMRGKVQRAIPERTFDGVINVEQQGKKIALNISDVTVTDGWVTVTAR